MQWKCVGVSPNSSHYHTVWCIAIRWSEREKRPQLCDSIIKSITCVYENEKHSPKLLRTRSNSQWQFLTFLVICFVSFDCSIAWENNVRINIHHIYWDLECARAFFYMRCFASNDPPKAKHLLVQMSRNGLDVSKSYKHEIKWSHKETALDKHVRRY